MLFIRIQTNLLPQKIMEWLDQVTNSKVFEYTNKIVNKEQPEENLLWFSSCSFHSLEEWLANQLQKSIMKHYFRKDLLPNYKLKQFTEYMSNKHPNQAKLLNLTVDQAQKFSKQEIESYCSSINNYENSYYQDLRQNFIESLQILQNDKGTRKKRKNKRKGKRINTDTQNRTQALIGAEQSTLFIQQNQKDSGSQQGQIIALQLMCRQMRKQQHQSTAQFVIQQEEQAYPQNKSEKGKNKKCICGLETNSQITSFEKGKLLKQKSSNSKNLVMNKQRSRSPYTKSNTMDDQCSKSTLSGQVYETFTQAITEECTAKAQQFQQQSFQGQMKDQSENGQQNLHNKKRRKRRNNNSNRYIEQMWSKASSGLINKQLTNFIDNLSIQTNNLYQSKVISFERVSYFIKKFHPETQAMLFGSNSMGLSLPSSDVDIMLYNVPCRSREEIKEMLAQIAIQINTKGWIVSCSTYLNAKVPLVKLQIDPLVSYFQTKRRCDYQNDYDPMILYYLDVKDRKKAKNIFVDLTINPENNDSGLSPSTQFMRNWVNQDPILHRILLVFKYILAEKGYNKNYIGGLGSYCLFIMIAAYFKQFKDSLPEDEGQIFLDILKFYSQQFQNKLKSITLREQGSCFISLEQSLSTGNLSQCILSNPLRIIDPLTLNLMSSSCAQYNSIKTQFRRIRCEILAEFQNLLKEISGNYTPIDLSKLVANKKSIEKWIHKYESRTRFSLKKIIDGNTQNR